MTQYFNIHPTNPQERLIQQVIDVLNEGGVIAFPTDSAYALGCRLGDKDAIERIRRLRALDKNHNFTLMCHDLSQLANYARVDNPSFRLLKAYTPGPYTFILIATKEVPRGLQHPKRKTIGLRVPDHPLALALIAMHGSPLISVTLILPDSEVPVADVNEIKEFLDGKVDAVIDAGNGDLQPTSIVDLTSGAPEVLRVGKGDVSAWL